MVILAHEKYDSTNVDRKKENELISRFTKFLQGKKYLLEKDVSISFSITPTMKRTGKFSNILMLEWLLSATDAVKVIEVKDIKLDFDNKVFTRGGKAIYLTAQEQLAIYQLYILKFTVDLIENWTQISHGLRNKFGNQFLIDLS